jgi:hypothetical protein
MGPLGMITPYPGISYLFSGDETARDGEESLLGIALGTGGAATFGGHTSPSSWNPLWADMVNKIDTKLKVCIISHAFLTHELMGQTENHYVINERIGHLCTESNQG